MTETLDAKRYLSMLRGGAATLYARRQQINELNVFPIPDGDTGDNMYMTIEAGLEAAGGTPVRAHRRGARTIRTL